MFSGALFWVVMGVLATVAFLGLRVWLEDLRIPMTWWKWLLVAVWAALVVFTISWIGTSLGEGEEKAAGVGGLLYGIPAIVLGVGLWRILVMGRRTASVS